MKVEEKVTIVDTEKEVMTSGVKNNDVDVFNRVTGLQLTSHALERSQQRCIPPLIISWLCQYGARKRSKNGTILYYFDRKSIRLISSDVGQLIVRRLSSLMDSYLVISGNSILTVGHRYKRIKNF